VSKTRATIRRQFVRFADLAGWLTIVDPRLLRSFYRNEDCLSYPVMTIRIRPVRWRRAVKRSMDILISLTAIVFLLPLFVIIALLVRFTSPGPVLYRSTRVGKNGRPFLQYNFRTMETNKEEMIEWLTHPNEREDILFKMSVDPRITRVGRFLRKSSMDELPQLLNVLKGDMSLVGPRPLRVRDIEAFDEEWKDIRLSMPPGITGLWLVRSRGSVTFEQWKTLNRYYTYNQPPKSKLKMLAQAFANEVSLDREYLADWSVWLDIKIFTRDIRNWVRLMRFRLLSLYSR
jgi:lipopolysaccharide/colanic/teichoic acid biosynthesis glycosyltransferase